MRWLLAAFLPLIFTACSVTRQVPPAVTYHLDPVMVAVAAGQKGCAERVIRVSPIQSPQWLQSTDIYYSDTHRRLFRYTRSRWEQPPTDQLQQLIENAVTQSGLFKGVIPYRSQAKNDWLLEIRLEGMMQRIADDGSAETELRLYAVLVEQYGRHILAQKHFDYVQTCGEGNAAGAVAAWSEGSAAMLKALIEWLEEECRLHPRVERGDVNF